MVNLKEIIQWAGLVSWAGAGLCLSVIGLKYAKGLMIPSSLLGKELEPIDKKLAKTAGVLFLIGTVLFFVAGMSLFTQ